MSKRGSLFSQGTCPEKATAGGRVRTGRWPRDPLDQRKGDRSHTVTAAVPVLSVSLPVGAEAPGPPLLTSEPRGPELREPGGTDATRLSAAMRVDAVAV